MVRKACWNSRAGCHSYFSNNLVCPNYSNHTERGIIYMKQWLAKELPLGVVALYATAALVLGTVVGFAITYWH